MRSAAGSRPMWITGRHPVEELLASGRQKPVRVLLSDSAPPEARKVLSGRAMQLGIPCLVCPKEEWERRTGDRGGPGIAAEAAEFRYAELSEWLESLPGRALAFLLDGITDPHNMGAILRNARAFGGNGVIVPKDRSCPVTAAVFRASAGAAAHVPVVLVTNLARTMETLQEKGFWLYAATEEGETAVSDMKPASRMGIVLGSEEHGIRKLVREKCDGSVRIPMERGIDSLNVGVASGILAFHLRSL
ncbi:MAG: 23S rRNA (guanosine(2251)-2'-O)-methyltransferase RlmB, partial [Deltaproteobacteria bacterium]|nr:23S rRNA (guanosine(2251)-2'-O)-methyltransferase RlmB [Deltaproteobacteria bacterium]